MTINLKFFQLFLVITLWVRSRSARLAFLTSSSLVSGRVSIAAAARFAWFVASSLVLCIPWLFPRYSRACSYRNKLFYWENSLMKILHHTHFLYELFLYYCIITISFSSIRFWLSITCYINLLYQCSKDFQIPDPQQHATVGILPLQTI